MVPKVNIKVIGAQKVQALIEGHRKRLGDLTVSMKQGSVYMLGSIQRNFRQGGRPRPWRPLSFGYLVRKTRAGYSPIPLTRTGQLQRSITRKFSRHMFKLGTSVPYAAVHQFGGGNGIPKRPYLLFQREDLKRVNRLVLGYIHGGR